MITSLDKTARLFSLIKFIKTCAASVRVLRLLKNLHIVVVIALEYVRITLRMACCKCWLIILCLIMKSTDNNQFEKCRNAHCMIHYAYTMIPIASPSITSN